jgi:preprotein translocase subunit YajC
LSLTRQQVKIQGYKRVAVARLGRFAGPFALLQAACLPLGPEIERWGGNRLACNAIEGPLNQGIFAVNSMLTTLTILFAQADSGGTAGGGPGAGGAGNPFITQMVPMIVIFAAMWYFFLHLPMKRERTRQAAMWASIKKNDRVLTTSGIYGVVTNVSKESNEVTLRIDETTSAKLRVTLNSVAQVLGDESSADTPSK